MILFKYFDQNFTLLNLALVLSVIAGMMFLRRVVKARLEPFLKEKEWKIGKENTVQKLLNQLIWVIGFFLVIGALGIGNKDFSLSNLFGYELFRIPTSKTYYPITIWKIISVTFLIFLTRFILNISKIVIFRVTKGKEWIDEGRRYTIVQLTKYVVYIIFTMMIIKSLGFEINSIIMAGSALLLGLGLGLKEMFTDVVSGFILLFDGSVKVGDVIELDNMIARVLKISIRTSHVKTMDGKIIIVPNSKLTEENVINWSISDKVTRFHIKVSVAYGSDTEKVKKLLYDCALKHPLVNKQRNITIMFNDFGDNGLQFELYFWAARTWEIMIIKSDLRFSIDKAFRENNIKIPYPQRDLHIVSDYRETPTGPTSDPLS